MAKATKAVNTTIGPVYQVRDLTAGVNLRSSPTNISPNQATRLLNTLISSPGELGVYPGFETFSTTSLGSRRAQGGKRIYLADSIFTLVADNGSIFKPSDAGVWGSAVLTGRNASNPIDFPYDRDVVAIFDGANAPKKSTDGSTWTPLGIAAPDSPTLALVSGGSLTVSHEYEIAYSYLNSTLNAESNASTGVKKTTTSGNLTIGVTVTASADGQVDKIRVYARDVTNGESLLRLFGTFDNTSTTIDVDSNNWDAQNEAQTINDVAVAMSFGIVWKNRWWGRDATVKNRLRFSQIFQSQAWPSTFFVDIPFERGEDITAIVPLGDVLVVFGYTKFYLIIGQTSLDFEVRPSLGGQTGAFGFRAADVLENGIVHASGPGLYLFDGASDQLLTYPIDPAWRSLVDQNTAAELSRLAIAYHKQVKELRVAAPYLFPVGGRGEWILDLNRTNTQTATSGGGAESTGPAWFSTDRAVGGYILWDGNETDAGDQGRIFSWDPDSVTLSEERTGITADGADRTMEYDGYMLPFGLQVARLVDSYLEYQPTSGTLTLDLKVDGRMQGEQTFSLGSDLPVYGTAVYGTDRYSASADRASLPVMWPDTAEGRAAQLVVKYTGQGDFKLFSYGHNVFAEAVPRGI